MRLLIPTTIINRLKRELRGRLREIGGILVGEHVSADIFRVADISVQHDGGAVAHFVRDPEHHKQFLSEFFSRTGHDYLRFNYIGEWHSHPAFQALPSQSDLETMYDIVNDPEVGANFAILLIARLGLWRSLQISVTLFRPGFVPEPVVVQTEDAAEIDHPAHSCLRRFLKLIGM